MIQKILFFFFIFVIAFIPGGIFISVFLLALYYLVPLFQNNSKEEKIKHPEYTISFKLVEILTDVDKIDNMNSYSDDTLEEMK